MSKGSQWLQQEKSCIPKSSARSQGLNFNILYFLEVSLPGLIHPVFVINRLSATIMDIGLYTLFCGVTARIQGDEVMIGALCSLGYVYVLNIISRYII